MADAPIANRMAILSGSCEPPRRSLSYDTLERLAVAKPVDRLNFISDLCRGRRALDLGCLDETALVKRDTEHWLHGRIASVADNVIGIDNSDAVPSGGLSTGPNSIIRKGDATNPEISEEIDIIVAGEFIEHIEDHLGFFRTLKRRFPGREVVMSTPNGLSFANTLMGMAGREAQHPDHIQIFTFKILNTLCQRADFQRWEIIPYRFYATEMILNSTGAKRALAISVQSFVRLIERIFPLLSFGYVVRAKL